MRAVVVGAGGLGSYVGALLARAGTEVTLVARGAHRDAIDANGLRIDGASEPFTTRPACVSSALEVEGADAVIVTVKAYSLDEVAPQVGHLADLGAVVLPLLNGVDATSRLERAGVAPTALVDGVAYLTAFRTSPGVVERKGAHQRVVVGSASGRSEGRVSDVVRLFGPTDVEVVVAEDIRVELWKKMAVVCSLAALCGMTGRDIGSVRTHPLGRAFQERAISEVLEVGRATGAAIGPEIEALVNGILDGFPPGFYPSVLHDLRTGHPTEMDALGGAIVRYGREAGVDTPLYEAATCVVQLRESLEPGAEPARIGIS